LICVFFSDTMSIHLQDASSTDDLTEEVRLIVNLPTVSLPDDC